MNSRFYDARRALPARPAAAALVYDPLGTSPPEVLAAGRGELAERIVAVAREHDIPLHEDASLVEALAHLEIGSLIPPELYALVAEVLAFVFAVDAGYAPP